MKTSCRDLRRHTSVLLAMSTILSCNSSREVTEADFFEAKHGGHEIQIHVPSDWGKQGYRAIVVPLCELRNGAIDFASVIVQRPRRGFFDNVYVEAQVHEPVVTIYSPFAVARSPLVSRHIFLLSNERLWKGWKVLELSADQLMSSANNAGVALPAFDQIPSLLGHPQERELRKILTRVAPTEVLDD